jgi:hypothetical protein
MMVMMVMMVMMMMMGNHCFLGHAEVPSPAHGVMP